MAEIRYDEDNIRTLEWKEHIRMRPGMYIGKLGDGSSFEDGIYILLKEVIDNSIDEYVMGNGKQIDISIIEVSAITEGVSHSERWWTVFPKSTPEVSTIQRRLKNR